MFFKEQNEEELLVICTGKKYGSKSCPVGSKKYNFAKTMRKINKK